MKAIGILFLLLLNACNTSDLPIQREEDYKGHDTPGRHQDEEELPVKKGVFNESGEKDLNLDN